MSKTLARYIQTLTEERERLMNEIAVLKKELREIKLEADNNRRRWRKQKR